MPQRPFVIPTWAPAVAAAAFVLWAASIWWMVATLPTGGDTGAIEDALDSVVAELESANTQIEDLGGQITVIEEERDALVARIEELESREPAAEAFQMSPAATTEDATVATQQTETSEFFTDGADRYNCRHFTSAAEAQEALEVNGASDPNRIDTNKNGLACEDFTYASTTAAVVATDE